MAQHNVSISNMQFSPDPLHIASGDTVVWTNLDDMGHSALRTDNPMPFDTGLLVENASSSAIEITGAAGPYPYICRQHHFMTATIIID
jgi:plastocyanin